VSIAENVYFIIRLIGGHINVINNIPDNFNVEGARAARGAVLKNIGMNALLRFYALGAFIAGLFPLAAADEIRRELTRKGALSDCPLPLQNNGVWEMG
jgi:hypothetical protein